MIPGPLIYGLAKGQEEYQHGNVGDQKKNYNRYQRFGLCVIHYGVAFTYSYIGAVTELYSSAADISLFGCDEELLNEEDERITATLIIITKQIPAKTIAGLETKDEMISHLLFSRCMRASRRVKKKGRGVAFAMPSRLCKASSIFLCEWRSICLNYFLNVTAFRRCFTIKPSLAFIKFCY
jgi:hypothetical protein